MYLIDVLGTWYLMSMNLIFEALEQTCLQLKVWIWSFLNIKNSGLEVSSKKGVIEIKILQNSLKNIRDAVFKLIHKISG